MIYWKSLSKNKYSPFFNPHREAPEEDNENWGIEQPTIRPNQFVDNSTIENLTQQDENDFSDLRIILPDEMQNATKPPPYVFCNRCCDSKHACEVFICANILFHVLQLTAHFFKEVQMTASIEFMFFFTEWGLAFWALYGLRKSSYTKLTPYFCWAIFETFMQVLFLIYVFHIVLAIHGRIHTQLENIHTDFKDAAANNPNSSLHQHHADHFADWKEQHHDHYMLWGAVVVMVQSFVVALGVFEVHCINLHRAYLIKTFGRES